MTRKKIKIPFLNKKERKLGFKTAQEKSGKQQKKLAYPFKN